MERNKINKIAILSVVAISVGLAIVGNIAVNSPKNIAECQASLDCLANKHKVNAIVACQAAIEGSAKYDYQWTDAALEPKFNDYSWYDQLKGVITYSGNKVKFQNGFGAWTHKNYECDYSTVDDYVLDVRFN